MSSGFEEAILLACFQKGALERPCEESPPHMDVSRKPKPPRSVAFVKAAPTVPSPDGPISWLMAALCFLLNLLFSSFFRCGGLFFTAMISTFGASRAQASLPLSTYCGFVNLSGLVAGLLIHFIGLRACVFLGGLLMSAGCMASAFSDGIPFLVVSIGVVTGSGHGILLACVIVAINEYFDLRRGTALGINMTGATAASFLLPKVWDLCLEEYGLQATYALVGAFLLNVVPISWLLRTPPWTRADNPKKNVETKKMAKQLWQGNENGPNSFAIVGGGEICALSADDCSTGEKVSSPHGLQIFCNSLNSTYYLTKLKRSNAAQVEKRFGRLYTRVKAISCDIIYQTNEERGKRYAALCEKDAPSEAPLWSPGRQQGERRQCVPECTSYDECRELYQISMGVTKVRGITSYEGLSECIHGRISSVPHITAGEVIEAKEVRSSTSILKCFLRSKDSLSNIGNGAIVTVNSAENGNETRLDEPLKAGDVEEKLRPRSVADSATAVLSMPRFYAHMLSYFSFCFYLDTFLSVAVDCALDAGISRADAAHVLTFFSITDTAGRLLIPLLTDYKLATPLTAMTASYLFMALIGTAMAHAKSSVSYWALLVTLGLPVGYVMVAMSQTVAADVGLRNLPMAYGLIAGLTAVGAFTRPLIIGYFRDTSGSYSGLFRLMGGMVFSSFLLTGWLRWTDARRGANEAATTVTSKRGPDSQGPENI